MDLEEVEAKLAEILGSDRSFYQYADEVTRLLTVRNVEHLMKKLPSPFREQYIAFALEAYWPEGPRIQLGGGLPMPESCLRAVRHWLHACCDSEN